MKNDFITLFVFILFVVLMTSCLQSRKEENECLNGIMEANRVKLVFFPIRSGKMSFIAKTITNKDEIKEICSFTDESCPEQFYETFPTLPDGYFEFFNDSLHIQNIYFVLDSSKGHFQLLENGKCKQKLINEKGYKFLKKIYDDKDWLPWKTTEKE